MPFRDEEGGKKARYEWLIRDDQIAKSKEADDDLPHDLIIEILLRLPPKDIITFRCVSKRWYHILTKDDKFTARYNELSKRKTVLLKGIYVPDENGEFNERRATVELTSVDMEGNVADRYNIIIHGGLVRTFISCGPLALLCCLNSLYVCNPSRQEASFVPYNYRTSIQNSGFGYLAVSGEYKIVLLYHEFSWDDDNYKMDCRIFTFRDIVKNGSWACKHQVCPKLTSTNLYSLNLDRKIYWPGLTGQNDRSILSFDLKEENFNSISCPPHDGNMYSFLEITGIRGSLGAIGCSVNTSTMDIWLFRDNENSWSTERHISLFPFSINYVVSTAAQGDAILIHTEQKGLLIYNIRTHTWRRIKSFDDLNRPCMYHYSLLRLHKNCSSTIGFATSTSTS